MSVRPTPSVRVVREVRDLALRFPRARFAIEGSFYGLVECNGGSRTSRTSWTAGQRSGGDYAVLDGEIGPAINDLIAPADLPSAVGGAVPDGDVAALFEPVRNAPGVPAVRGVAR